MKIVHICLCGAMTDGFNYQENVITKYHKKLGLDVTVIASQWIWDTKGNLTTTSKTEYINDDGVKMVRLPMKRGTIDSRFKIYPTLYETVERENPDILFIHDCQFLDITKLAKYAKKHPSVTVYVDNHVDHSNGAHGWLSKNILHKGLWKHCVKKIEPYVKKFYGVLPARVDFLTEMYGLPADKCELLVMGADDELVEKVTAPGMREQTREKYGIADDDFLIVTGGKINQYRTETLQLMEAVINSNQPIKLLIFGSVDESLKPRFDELCKSPNLVFAGWQNSLGTYSIMAAADLIVFPGLHSVMWEQAVALGVPCIFRDIEGFHHVNLGGNAIFIKDPDAENLRRTIEELLDDKEKYDCMKAVAQEEGMKTFSYREIAKKSIEA